MQSYSELKPLYLEVFPVISEFGNPQIGDFVQADMFMHELNISIVFVILVVCCGFLFCFETGFHVF